MAKFDSKSFNPQAFGAYVSRIPKLKKNEMIKSGALRGNSEIRNAFNDQTGTAYAVLPMYGLLGGNAQNYDGVNNINAASTPTYERGVVVVGRAQAWSEKDFSEDITGGAGFMDNVAAQVSDYFDGIDQNTVLAILEGIFSMTGSGNLKFVNNHTYDITGSGNGCVGSTTLNTAIQRAGGDNKNAFKLVIMHSAVATNLENLDLLDYMKYTDKDGIQRNLALASWNGRTVLIDDSMPASNVESTAGVYEMTVSTKATSGDKITINDVELVAGTDFSLSTDTPTGNAAAIATALNASTDASVSGYTWSNNGAKLIATEDSGHYGEGAFVVSVTQGDSGTLVVGSVSATTDPVVYTAYTTYVLGEGAFDYEDIGAKVPYEMSRDPKTNGGIDTLYARQRKCFAPYGISYTKASQSTLSPTDSELKNGANWELVNDGATTKTYIDHKSIPIARIISKG